MSKLNSSQEKALKILKSTDNVFLTGAAGSGKSFLLKHYIKEKYCPILASTGAAAILVGGRTFHSFFGLGIMEGGFQATVDRAVNNKRIKKRLSKTDTVVLDEVSMISGPTLRAAETIARKIRGNTTPWGGMRIIAVGDFAQLPPVNPFGKEKEWAFLDPVWEQSEFKPVLLTEIMRTSEVSFLKILNLVRQGVAPLPVHEFLNQRMIQPTEPFDGTRLLARREDVERYNLSQLQKLGAKIWEFQTVYTGKEQDIEKFKKNSPIPDVITIKIGALVMLRQNDPSGQWVNGSLGHVQKVGDEWLEIKLVDGPLVSVGKVDFTLLDADGIEIMKATNFPVNLAWAVTIHKAQGTTLEKMWVDLRRLWEPGQAYVALSRVKSSSGLFIEGWHQNAIMMDASVKKFYENMRELS